MSGAARAMRARGAKLARWLPDRRGSDHLGASLRKVDPIGDAVRATPGTTRHGWGGSMSWFLFVDESGQDRRASPYEVLAGVAVEDRQLWDLILDVHVAEERFFGQRISNGHLELKAKKLLKRKVYRLANGSSPIPEGDRIELVVTCLAKGSAASRAELAALGQAKLAFVEHVLEVFGRHDVRVFASAVDRDAPRPESSYLRKDYAYLFERFFYFLEERADSPRGIVVFDELEKAQRHLLVDQMRLYFLETATGRRRAWRVVPEPFFAHSDLTTAVQLADLVAYIVSWGARIPGRMDRDRREEVAPLWPRRCATCATGPRWSARVGRSTSGRSRSSTTSGRAMNVKESRTKRKGNAGRTQAKPPGGA